MSQNFPIGWVLRASTVGFSVGCRVLQPDTPRFGDLVKVTLPPDGVAVYGLIHNVEVRDDPSVRQLILVGEMEPEAILDQRENRLVPIELSVLIVGYQRQGRIVQGLPPQPPLSLDQLTICDDQEIRQFAQQLRYFRLLLNASQLPVDELLIANIQRTAEVYGASPERQRQFLLRAGRELALLLQQDLLRLNGILERIRP